MSDLVIRRYIAHLGLNLIPGQVISDDIERADELISSGAAVRKQHNSGGTSTARETDGAILEAARALISGTVRGVLPQIDTAPREVLEVALELDERVTVQRAIEAALNG